MSHSKMTKRGRSQFIESWNSRAKKFINECKVCGRRGYSPTIDTDGFCEFNAEHSAILCELKKTLPPLPLDDLGRCEICAKNMDIT